MERPKPSADSLNLSHQVALAYLLEESQLARYTGDLLAVYSGQLCRLRAIGVTDTILRWLAGRGLVEHRAATSSTNQPRRTFRPSPNLRFTPGSYFLLTPSGTELAECLAAKDELDTVHSGRP